MTRFLGNQYYLFLLFIYNSAFEYIFEAKMNEKAGKW